MAHGLHWKGCSMLLIRLNTMWFETINYSLTLLWICFGSYAALFRWWRWWMWTCWDISTGGRMAFRTSVLALPLWRLRYQLHLRLYVSVLVAFMSLLLDLETCRESSPGVFVVTSIANKHDWKWFDYFHWTLQTEVLLLGQLMREHMCVGFQVWWHAGMASALEPSALQGSGTPVPDGTGGSEQEPPWNTHRPHLQVSAHTFSSLSFCLPLCVSFFPHSLLLVFCVFFFSSSGK